MALLLPAEQVQCFAVVLLATLLASPLLLLIGSVSSTPTATAIVSRVATPQWICVSFGLCCWLQGALHELGLSDPTALDAVGFSVLPNAPTDLLASTFAVAAFLIVLVTDLVMVILWPGMLQGAHRTVWVSTAINAIACVSYILKLRAGSALHSTDVFGRALSLSRYVTWMHTLPLMSVLVLSLTDVSAQETCWRICLSMALVIVGFFGSFDLGAGALPLSAALLCVAQAALTQLCCRLHASLAESRTFAWQRQLLGLFVFVTLHLFPLIYASACLLRLETAREFQLMAAADVVSKLLITTTMLQGHIRVASCELVCELDSVMSARQMMRDDLRQLISHAYVPIMATNAEGRVTVWNKVVAEISGVSAEQAEGVVLWELAQLTETAAEGARKAISHILHCGASTSADGAGGKGGAEARASVTFELSFRNDHARASSSSGSVTSETMTDAFHCVAATGADAQPRTPAASAAAAAGRPAGAPSTLPPTQPPAIGSSASAASAASATIAASELSNALREPAALSSSLARKPTGGGPALLLVNASLTHGSDGAPSGLVCVCADMTSECERLIAIASRAQVEAVNDAKDKFLACMSHEMRTPLSALIGLLQLVSAKQHADWTHHNLQPLVLSSLRSAEHLYVLVSDVLDMSKVQHGKLALNIREFSLVELLDAVSDRCRHVLSAVASNARPVEFKVVIDEHAPRVLRGDAQRLEQILSNLGTNAIKYTLHGNVTIEVLAKPLARPSAPSSPQAGAAGDASADDSAEAERLWQQAAEYAPRRCAPVELSVLVSDTGIGIPKNALKRIFDLFETQTGDNALAKTTNSGVSSASGIGLTICKELVDAMGGSLSVQSTLGMGSTFEFKLNTLAFVDGPFLDKPPPSLPAAAVGAAHGRGLPPPPDAHARAQEQAEDEAEAAAAGPPPPARVGHVLLVEDDEMNRVVISMFLDDEVGAITEAHNGLEAIVIAFRELKAGAAREEGAAGEGRAAAGGGGEGGASSQPASPLAHRAAAAPASPVLRANGGAAGGAAAGGGAAGIDVIVMDVNMPMLSGRQAAQLVRLMQYGVSCWAGAIPIVALTANAMDSELRKCINAGMTACLTKPVPRQALLDICATALSTGRRANGEGAAAPSGAEAAEAMRAQVDASRPLLCELGSLLVTALRHTVGVRLDMAGRAAALLGCLGWALQLLGAEPEAVRQIDALLADAAAHGLSEDALTARARSLLAERGQDWLEQAGLVDAAQAALSAP